MIFIINTPSRKNVVAICNRLDRFSTPAETSFTNNHLLLKGDLHLNVIFQGILGMLSTINYNFFSRCYSPLGDLMDDIALINSSINFIIYSFMSKQFRKTFLETFGLVRKTSYVVSERIKIYSFLVHLIRGCHTFF